MHRQILRSILLATAVITTSLMSAAQLPKEQDLSWVKYSRIFIIDGYFYPLCPVIEFDAEKLAETMVDMHVSVVRMGTAGICGWMIPGTEFKVTDNLGNRDLLKECIEACKPRGIKVVAYISTGHKLKTDDMKPEWAQKITPSGDIPSTWSMGNKTSPVCWNTSYRQAFYDYVKQVVSKYDIDGIYFDRWREAYFWQGPKQLCYCDGCVKGFKAFSGKDIPYRERAVDYTREELQTIDLYHKWLYDILAGEIFNETRRIVKSYKDIPLIYNINSPREILRQDPRILKGSDGFLYERGRSIIERAEGVSLATAHGLAVWPYVGTYNPFPRIPHHKYEIGQEIYTSVAFGGSPILFHSYYFAEHPEARAIVKDAFEVFDKNELYIKGFNPYKFCAVVYNEDDPPGHASKGSLWEMNARLSSLGSFYACLNSHIQTTSLLKADLENYDMLSEYKVLYLPDICYLTDKQVQNIKRFVENGGGLIMTYTTSLYDENGKKRDDFELGKLAGVKLHIPGEEMIAKLNANRDFGSVMDMYLQTRNNQNIIKPPLSDGLIPTHLFQTVDALPESNIVADIVKGAGSEKLFPGIVASRYGKGKIVYLATETGSLFLQTGIRELSELTRHLIEYVSPEKIPYEIDAPPSVLFSNMTVNGNKSVIHLVNWPGSQSERMWHNVYHIPSLENVSIRFSIPGVKKIKNVKTFIPVDFTSKIVNGNLYITLSKVDKYQGVIIETE